MDHQSVLYASTRANLFWQCNALVALAAFLTSKTKCIRAHGSFLDVAYSTEGWG